ncbi:MAG: beta-galactosidase [Bacteroidales bacterium]|nr:beta-galactosidase [Bacteroidales bacterium]
MKGLRFLLAASTLVLLSACSSPESLPLGGTWRFAIDREDAGETQHWYASRIDGDNVTLPGSMLTNGKGDPVTLDTKWTAGIWDSVYFKAPLYAPYREPGNIKVPFFLQPETYYVGPAWYQREVEIPSGWAGKSVEMSFERAHWECKVWVDGQYAGMQNTLSAPDVFDLSAFLTPGRHTLTLRVDNRVQPDLDPGDSAHSVSDHTQGNWNGVAGAMTLTARECTHLERIRVRPDLEAGILRVSAAVTGSVPEGAKLTATLLGRREEVTVSGPEASLEIPLPLEVEAWDEFHPNLYTVSVALELSGRGADRREIRFGCRSWEARGRELYLNGHPAFLRGTVDCAAYPLTGFAPFDKETWLHNLQVCKSFGINHIRFHSWCPPEAAFEAADELGMYFQIEASVWAYIGDGKPIDQWIYDETGRILDHYANHPSFCLMAHGNEPHGDRHEEYLTKWVPYWQEREPGILFTAGANWPNLPVNGYLNDGGPRIQAWEANLTSVLNACEPATDYDWTDYVSKQYGKPIIAHEIGQWCAYPNFTEMAKYTGPLKPRNFEIFQETLQQHGMGELAEQFTLASGKLQNLCYKADIEAELRTPGVQGFQLLSLIDFPGQGSALTGALDVFYGEKGYASPEDYLPFNSPLVPLARMQKLVYTSSETFRAELQAANFWQPMDAAEVHWRLLRGGETVREGVLPAVVLPLGHPLPLGEVNFPLADIAGPEQLRFEVAVGDFANSWDIWVFPTEKQVNTRDVLLTDKLDTKALRTLAAGGKVLLSIRQGTLAPAAGGDIALGFSSIFWNASFTNGQAPHTLGILCDPEHPALSGFPTEYHSNYQWHDPVMHASAIRLDVLAAEDEAAAAAFRAAYGKGPVVPSSHTPVTAAWARSAYGPVPPVARADVQPLVRVIDDWYNNRPLALLVEAKVGGGSLLVSGIDFHREMASRPASLQLLRSLLDYMRSDAFAPSAELPVESVLGLLPESR